MVGERCKNATLCLDPLDVCQWASAALDEVRREVWNAARRGGQTATARQLKDARFAYLLKEQLRQVFHLRQPWRALRVLDDWLIWARRCRLPAFVKLARSISEHRAGIGAALRHNLSNARVELNP